MVTETQTRTAVLLDPSPVVLSGIEQVLVSSDVAVVGKSTSSERALALAKEHEPDVLVAEIDLPEAPGAGLECLRAARMRVPDLKPIVFAGSNDPRDIEAAFDAGAAAYVVKTAHPADLVSAVRQAFDHSLYFSSAPAPARSDDAGLTSWELEVLRLVAEGRSNAEVARSLWVTEQTVKFHLSNIYRKLGVANRTGASRWAHVHGLAAPAEASARAAAG